MGLERGNLQFTGDCFPPIRSQFNDRRNTISSGSGAAIRFQRRRDCMVDNVHTES
jgi:hypothetical protein